MESNTQNTNETKSNNTLSYILGSFLILSIGYISYIYSSYDMLKKGQLEDKYISKSTLDFSMLSSYEKSRYIEIYTHNNQIENLKQEIRGLQNNTQISSPKIVEKIVEVPVEKIVEKIVEVEKIIQIEKTVQEVKDIQNTTKIVNEIKESNLTFDTYTCKTMKSGGIKISQKCKKELQMFLEKNKNSKMYEVIGMVNNQDFKFIKKLKDVYGEKKIKHLSKYSQIGLSRQRVIEATWLLKKQLGNYKNIKTVNYTVNAKDKKGFIVRAYK